MDQKMLHIISHTDLDGVVAAAVAWHAVFPEQIFPKVSLTGYGDLDALVLYTIRSHFSPLVLDLFCQRQETIDGLDSLFSEKRDPVFFDHHKTTQERYGNRSWVCIDTSCCAAMVYHRWLLEKTDLPRETRKRMKHLAEIVAVANDRDLWLGERPESRLWQALVTLCGPWSVLMRLVANVSAKLSEEEKGMAEAFVLRQEERFVTALDRIVRHGTELTWVGPDLLEFGDVSDFCGLVLDRLENPPRVVAVANRRPTGDWAISLRSRDALAARLVGLLKDGKKIRGGGHDDAAAVYFPSVHRETQIQDALLVALRMAEEQDCPLGMSLGDLLRRPV